MNYLLIKLIRLYQITLSAFVGQHCRFTPTCSHYAIKAIENSIIDIIQEELEAEKNNCQIIWVKSKIICSNYKIFGELKFRDKETRNIDKRDKCLKRIGKILQNKFNVFIRLRAFSIQDASITALDLVN